MRYLTVCFLALFFSSKIFANEIVYTTSIENSKWQITKNTPLLCKLTHDIQNYGIATFSSRASKINNLRLDIKAQKFIDQNASAKIISLAPNWLSGTLPKEIGKTKIYRQQDIKIQKHLAKDMLNELINGWQPRIFYMQNQDKISAVLVAVNFYEQYLEFQNCQENLLSFDFNDIKFSNFDFLEDTKLTIAAKENLDNLEKYLKADKNIDKIMIKSYTNSYGTKQENKILAKKRSDLLLQRFLTIGILPEYIETKNFGEKNFIATNKTHKGRIQNARIIVELQRNTLKNDL